MARRESGPAWHPVRLNLLPREDLSCKRRDFAGTPGGWRSVIQETSMANVVTIEAETRTRAGKGAARATRRAGKVPGVIYGGKQEPSLIALEPRAVLRELHRAGWQSRLYELQTDGEP